MAQTARGSRGKKERAGTSIENLFRRTPAPFDYKEEKKKEKTRGNGVSPYPQPGGKEEKGQTFLCQKGF